MALEYWQKRGESRLLFEHPWLKVYEDTIVLPNGHEGAYLHFGTDNRISSASIIAIHEDGKFLLQKELSYPTGKFLWQWPGGAIEENESVEEGANRELMEESGYRAKTLEKLGEYYVNNRRSGNLQAAFLARDLTEESLPEDDVETFEHAWFTEEEIDSMIRQGEIQNSFCLTGWALYKTHL